MRINACRRCGSRSISKLPGGELGRESFHCEKCGAMAEPKSFLTEDEYSGFLKSLELAKNPPTREEKQELGFIHRNYRRILIGGILVMFLIFIAIAAVVLYLTMRYAMPPSNETGAQTTTVENITCEPPFAEIGATCCRDQNSNYVCDIEEVAVPKTTVPTTSVEASTTVSTTLEETTSVSTTLEPQTTTVSTTIEATSSLYVGTTIVIACYKDNDCGTEKVKYVCNLDDVYEVHEIPVCRNPGTPQATCTVKQRGVNPNEPRTLVLTCKDPKKCVPGEKRCA